MFFALRHIAGERAGALYLQAGKTGVGAGLAYYQLCGKSLNLCVLI